MKVCKTCNEEKTLDHFPTYTSGQPKPVCRNCYNQRAKRWRANNADKVHASEKAWRLKHRGYGRLQRAKRRMAKATNYLPPNAWQRMLDHYGAVCMKCGATDQLELDHIKPLSKEGEHGLWNLQILCKKCNSGKRDRDTTDYRPYPHWCHSTS